MEPELLKYEDLSSEIDNELEKRRGRWRLEKGGISFEDIKQEIKLHIWKKWSKWKQTKPFSNWVNRVITNQLWNKLRNHYGNFARPCVFCHANEGNNMCHITKSGVQCAECPLFAKWEKTKKNAHAINLPESLSNHDYEIGTQGDDYQDPEKFLIKIAPIIKKKCLPQTYKVFQLVFLKNLSDKDAAKKMGYKTSEKGRAAGYKQIFNHTEIIKQTIKEILSHEDARFIDKDFLN